MVTFLRIAAFFGAAATALNAVAADSVQVLILETSESFAHSPTVSEDGKPSLLERTIKQIVPQEWNVVATKDASTINAENLKKYQLVIFYTQGDLTKPNKTGTPQMGENGVADLIAWIEQGGGFVGFHSATDTFRGEGDTVTPYTEMIGAEFAGHGKQFVGKVVVTDPNHPVMKHVPANWELNEEWYTFRKFNKGALRVLALLDCGEERRNQEMYNVPNYPIIWVRSLGKGRVYYSALGHREDVWENPTFQQTVRDALNWALGEGPSATEPNFASVVPTELPKEKEK